MQDYTTIVGIISMRQKGFSYVDIQRRYRIGSSTVTRIMRRYEELGRSLDDLESLSPHEVEEMFYPPETRRRKRVDLPNFAWVHTQMQVLGKNADLALVWQAYKQQNPDGYQLSQFYKLYGVWLKEQGYKSKSSMPIERIPGQKMFIDWMGDKPKLLVDSQTGEVSAVHIFVTTLGFSSKVYAEAFLDEKISSFIQGSTNALSFYGALPEQLVPDNCKTAVTKHSKDDLVLNSAYQDIEDYYGVVIVPAPPSKPKGKATVENSVLTLERLIAARFKDSYFTSLSQLNSALAKVVADVNAKAFTNKRDIRKSRNEAFEKFDLPQMRKLPGIPFASCDYRYYARIPDNYHLEYDGHYYSVSHTLRGKPAILKATMSEIRICSSSNKLMYVHKRAWSPLPLYITDDAHMPSEHLFNKQVNEHDGAYYRRWAASIGPNTTEVIDKMLRRPRHEAQAYRSCAGALHATKGMNKGQVEQAAQACILAETYTYTLFKKMLTQARSGGLDGGVPTPPKHSNIRGKEAWK